MKLLKKAMVFIIALAVLLPTQAGAYASGQDTGTVKINPVDGLGNDFIMGADVSMLKDIEEAGGQFFDIGSNTAGDALEIMKAHGVNWIRLRIWNDPVTDENGKVGNDTVLIDGEPAPAGTPGGAGTCDEAHTIAMALRAKALGMKVLLDFHYSDFWADPGKQTKPKAWKNLGYAGLQDAVYNYTRQVLQDMKDAGAMPDMVQIGNETNSGMLFPDGNIGHGFAGWIGLINAGTKAVREVGGSDTKIMIHLADGGDNSLYRKVFDKLTDFVKATDYVAADDRYNGGKTGIDFDVIGFSYYPFWHGNLDKFRNNMLDVAHRYGKEVAVAEIGYGYTFENGDEQSNAFGTGNDELSGYQATVQGQAQLLRDVMEVVSEAEDSDGNNVGLGIFYWEPAWIPVPDSEGHNQVGWITGGGNDSDNRALFDFTGHALPSLDVFNLVKKSISELPEGRPYTYEITGLRSLNATVTVGQTPDLPSTVLANYSDGTIREVPVDWDDIDPSYLTRLQDFTLTGSVEGTTEEAVLNVTVIGKRNYAENPGFESGGLSGWTVTEDSPGDVETKAENSPGNNAYTGDNCFSYYISPAASGFTIRQTVTGLPDGSYTLRVVSHGGDTAPVERHLFAKDYGGGEETADFENSGWRNWVFPEIRNIHVTNGQCTIGVRVDTAGVGTWGKLDDFELYPDLSSANLTLPYSIRANSQFVAELSYSRLIYNVYAQDVTIDYNADELEFVSAEGASDNVLVTAIDGGVPGKVRILAADTGDGGLSWNADSLNLTFEAKAGAKVSNGDLSISKALLGTTGGSVAEPAGLATLRAPRPGGDDDEDNGSGSPSAPPPAAPLTPPAKAGEVAVNPPEIVAGTARVTVGQAAIDSAFAATAADTNGIKTVTIPVSKIEGQSSYEAVLPVKNVGSDDPAKRIRISTEVGSILVPSNMLPTGAVSGVQNAGIRITAVDAAKLGDGLKARIGDRPVVELAMELDGKAFSWNNPDAPVTVSIPYTPDSEELKDPEHIVVWYIDGNGQAFSVPDGRYDPATGTVTFKTPHFSKYAVAFSQKTFTDLGGHEWARNPIEVLASRGVTEGISENSFSPGASITRADFTVMLVRALGLSARFDDSFADVKAADYYYEAVGVAKKLGMTNGTGGNRFSPGESITRQDMMVMTLKALKASGRLAASGATASLDSYSDSKAIASYAYESISRLVGEGLIVGSNNALRPGSMVTRAEAAVIVYRAAKK